jgi:hypothetical protein
MNLKFGNSAKGIDLISRAANLGSSNAKVYINELMAP